MWMTAAVSCIVQVYYSLSVVGCKNISCIINITSKIGLIWLLQGIYEIVVA